MWYFIVSTATWQEIFILVSFPLARGKKSSPDVQTDIT
jgi:hypothetical protein